MEIIIGIIIAVLVVWLILGYNKFIKQIEAVKNSEKEIDIQLDRRGKVFDSLINSVKKYMDHERGVFKEIVELRSMAKSGGKATDDEKVKEAQEKLSDIVNSGKLDSSINVAVEEYPELKSSENMLQLQEEIVSTENKLSFAKKGLNRAIEKYNITKRSFPSNLIVKIFSSLDEDFKYWSLSEEKKEQEEERRVNF
tara:strand:+ start:677 stop:1264 length:588 start_codon:yes stop_codon:yes gene_type:complete